MPRKPYKKLRGVFAEHDIDRDYLGQLLGRGNSYLYYRMNAIRPWDQDDMYKIMDSFNLPYDKLHEYFPKGGATYSEKIKGTKDTISISG